MTKSRDLGNLVSDGASSGVAVYATIDAMTSVASPSAGDLAYVTANTSLYQNNGNGWYKIATVNTSPAIGSVSETTSGSTTALSDNGTFTLTAGTNTVVTITASDTDPGTDLVYSHTVTSGTESNVATITQGSGASENVFTFAPATSVGGTIAVRFDVTDNTNTAQFTNSFSITFSTPYSLRNASYDNVTGYYNDYHVFRGMTFNNDGSKLFILNYGNSYRYVSEYNLGTDWDITSKTHVGNLSYSSEAGFPYEVHWGDSGSKLYILDTWKNSANSQKIFLYNANTAYQVTSGCSYANKSFDYTSDANNQRCMVWKSDGTKFWMSGSGNGLYEFSVSPAWEVQNASYVGNTAWPSGTNTPSGERGLMFSPNGDILTVNGSYHAIEYTLSSAWNISTLTYSRSFVTDSQISGGYLGQSHFNTTSTTIGGTAIDAGRKVFITNRNDYKIYRYSVG